MLGLHKDKKIITGYRLCSQTYYYKYKCFYGCIIEKDQFSGADISVLYQTLLITGILVFLLALSNILLQFIF